MHAFRLNCGEAPNMVQILDFFKCDLSIIFYQFFIESLLVLNCIASLTSLGLRVAGCELRVAVYEFRIAGYPEFQIQDFLNSQSNNSAFPPGRGPLWPLRAGGRPPLSEFQYLPSVFCSLPSVLPHL